MRRSTIRPIRLTVVFLLGGAMALAACGDDDGGGGGSTEAFCSELESFAASADASGEADDSFVSDFRTLAESAPDEISDEINEMLAAFESLDELPDEPETEEQMEQMMDLLSSIEEPSAAVEEFATANCPDLPASVFGG